MERWRGRGGGLERGIGKVDGEDWKWIRIRQIVGKEGMHLDDNGGF